LAWLLVAAVLALAWAVDSVPPLPSGRPVGGLVVALGAAPFAALAVSAIAVLVWLARGRKAGAPAPAPPVGTSGRRSAADRLIFDLKVPFTSRAARGSVSPPPIGKPWTGRP
jgi:hypothetical protein